MEEYQDHASASAEGEDGALGAPSSAPETAPKPPLTFTFGAGTATPKKENKVAFYGAFVGIIAFCMAVLVLLLFLGDAGIKLFRETTTERIVYVRESGTGEGMLTPEEAADAAQKYTVTISARRKNLPVYGSGFVYRADGYIVTNYHVIENTVDLQVVLPSGEALDAKVVGYNAPSDLAVLKIDRTELAVAPIGSSANLLVGEDVLAMGTPGGPSYAGTATFGKVSATSRIMPITDDTGMVVKRMNVIQTDTSVNPGNSGGPLVDMYGRVVGVVVMRLANYEGMGFALPIDGVVTIVEGIVESGHFIGENPIAYGRNLVGIAGFNVAGEYWYANLTGEKFSQSRVELPGFVYVPMDGVFVRDVNGTNAFGRLAVGDILTHVNGMRVYTIGDLIGYANVYPSYATVTVSYLRQQNGVYTAFETEIVLAVESGLQ